MYNRQLIPMIYQHKGKILAFTILFVLVQISKSIAQKNYTKAGYVRFYSATPIENIEAINKSVVAVLDAQTGNIQVSVLMKGFEFEKALMQEHFNENYVESNKFPKAVFTGTITDFSKVIYAKDGMYSVKVKGKLSIHGVEHDIETSGLITIAKGIPQVITEFSVNLADYKISIPSIVAEKIAKQVKITMKGTLDNVLK